LQVVRDIHYDGNARPESCAIVLRLSPTFLRFGSFEAFLPARATQHRHAELAQRLLDYVCARFFPEG
jgi:uncharacterized protein YdiU (UPF0061 family)